MPCIQRIDSNTNSGVYLFPPCLQELISQPLSSRGFLLIGDRILEIEDKRICARTHRGVELPLTIRRYKESSDRSDPVCPDSMCEYARDYRWSTAGARILRCLVFTPGCLELLLACKEKNASRRGNFNSQCAAWERKPHAFTLPSLRKAHRPADP